MRKERERAQPVQRSGRLAGSFSSALAGAVHVMRPLPGRKRSRTVPVVTGATRRPGPAPRCGPSAAARRGAGPQGGSVARSGRPRGGRRDAVFKRPANVGSRAPATAGTPPGTRTPPRTRPFTRASRLPQPFFRGFSPSQRAPDGGLRPLRALRTSQPAPAAIRGGQTVRSVSPRGAHCAPWGESVVLAYPPQVPVGELTDAFADPGPGTLAAL